MNIPISKFAIILCIVKLYSCVSLPQTDANTRYLYPNHIAQNYPQRMLTTIREGAIIICINNEYVELKGDIFNQKFAIKMKVNEIIEQDSTLGSVVAMYTTTYKGKDLSEKNTKDIISIVEVPGKPIWIYFKAIELSTNKENSLGFICKSESK